MQPDRECDQPDAPILLTDSIICVDFLKKASDIFSVLGWSAYQMVTENFYHQLRKAIRSHLLEKCHTKFLADCQTAQAMGIYYGIFEKEELPAAKQHLLELIEESNHCIHCGILGLRVIFYVLTEMGCADTAYEMITQKEFPSYAYFIEQGLTTLPESFKREYKDAPGSLNHHYFGDISNWFIRCIAGICVNDDLKNIHHVDIKPHFLKQLQFAQASYQTDDGKLTVHWKRMQKSIWMRISVPKGMDGAVSLPDGYVFTDGTTQTPLKTGEFQIIKTQSKGE